MLAHRSEGTSGPRDLSLPGSAHLASEARLPVAEAHCLAISAVAPTLVGVGVLGEDSGHDVGFKAGPAWWPVQRPCGQVLIKGRGLCKIASGSGRTENPSPACFPWGS